MLAIETDALEKSYQTDSGTAVHAVRGVNLAIRQGEIYALLGPNGAGKTTTVAILTTLLLPTAGTARVAGYDVVSQAAEVRRRIGVTFQEVVLDGELTGRQALEFHAQLYGMGWAECRSRVKELAELVELDDVLERKTHGYSGGMKRRLELARGLMTAPSILFLDEPTQGLDPHNRAGIWRYVRRLRDEAGITLLLTTHSMEEAETLANRVGIIDHGQLVVEGTPKALVRAMGADVISLQGSGNADAMADALRGHSYVSHTTLHNQGEGASRLQVGVDSGDRRLSDVVHLAAANSFHIHEISVARPSLGDVFLAHTGHALRDG